MLRTNPPLLLRLPVAFLATALLVAGGCWTEVPNEAPPEKSTKESSAENEGSVEGKPAEIEPVEGDLPPVAGSPEPIATPVEPDRYASQEPPNENPLPWETGAKSDESSPEAERLFGKADEPIESELPAEAEATKEARAAEETDSFESFLTEAYADLNDEPADSTETMPAHESPPSEPREPSVEEEKVDLPTKEPVEETPFEDLFGESPEETQEEMPEETQEKTDSLESLFGESEIEKEPEPTPPKITPAPSRYAEESLLVPPAEPVEMGPESLGEETSAEIWPTIDPLPAVPVLTYNTRHLAWLLGGKLSLAQLADVGGASPDEVAQWTEETARLAEQLKVEAPPSADPNAPADERVGRLLNSAAAIGAELSDEYGADHAALVEMALKSNALLVLHERRPDLTPAVTRAIAAAADRADLPGYIWRDVVKELERRPTVDEVFDAVMKLHADVEAYLR